MSVSQKTVRREVVANVEVVIAVVVDIGPGRLIALSPEFHHFAPGALQSAASAVHEQDVGRAAIVEIGMGIAGDGVQFFGLAGRQVSFLPDRLHIETGTVSREIDIEESIAIDVGSRSRRHEKLLAQIARLLRDLDKGSAIVPEIERGFDRSSENNIGIAVVVEVGKESAVDAVLRE